MPFGSALPHPTQLPSPLRQVAGPCFARLSLQVAPVLVCLFLASTANAQPVSTWERLPESTLAAGRLIGDESVVGKLRDETKLGEVLFSEERVGKIGELMAKRLREGAENVSKVLENHDLEAADLTALLTGETGIALVAGDEDTPGSSYGMLWFSSTDERFQKLMSAFEELLEELEADDVIEIFETDIDGISALTIQKRSDETLDNAVLAILEDRLVIAYSLGTVSAENSDQHTQWLSDGLAAALSDASNGYFASMAADNRPSAPSGTLFFEAAADIQAFIDWSTRISAPENSSAGEQVQQVIEMLGVGSAEAATFTMTLDEGAMNQTLFVALPGPREGIAQLLDQEQSPLDPPAWVPSAIVSYSQANFDLKAAYEVVETAVLEYFPEAGTGFQMANAQTASFLQSSVAELLGSLGTKHCVVQLEPQVQEIEGQEDTLGRQVQEPMAFVWQLEDEPLWNKVIQLIGQFAPPTAMQPTDEQGFRGYRAVNAPIEGGVMLGQGHLVLAIGDSITEVVLSSLNNPPSGSDAFRDSDLFERANDLTELRPVITGEISDGNRLIQFARTSLEQLSSEYEELTRELDEEADNSMDVIADLLPTAEEAKDILGVVVTQFYSDDSGIILHSVNELPPAN
ncbi:MAG TPA: hypothetical protein DDW52_06235 [Planctomycetaceae bacterium]|nr:hypothetical protein [Planctomycetaceae bacterium]